MRRPMPEAAIGDRSDGAARKASMMGSSIWSGISSEALLEKYRKMNFPNETYSL